MIFATFSILDIVSALHHRYLSLGRVDAHVGRRGGARVQGHVTGGGRAVAVDVRQLTRRAES